MDHRTVPGVDDDGVQRIESPKDPLRRVIGKHYDWGVPEAPAPRPQNGGEATGPTVSPRAPGPCAAWW